MPTDNLRDTAGSQLLLHRRSDLYQWE